MSPFRAVLRISVSLLALVLMPSLNGSAGQSAPRQAYAAGANVSVGQSCSGIGFASLHFYWDFDYYRAPQGASYSVAQWIDMSMVDNGFNPVMWKMGPLSSDTSDYSWPWVLGNVTVFVRVNTQYDNGAWYASPTYPVKTDACFYAAAGENVGNAPGGGARAFDPPQVPSAPAPSQYRLTADVGGQYRIGDSIRLCYHMQPTNVPFTIRVSYSPDGGRSYDYVGAWSDSGGGDCLPIPVSSTTQPGQKQFLLQATIGGTNVQTIAVTNIVGSQAQPGPPITQDLGGLNLDAYCGRYGRTPSLTRGVWECYSAALTLEYLLIDWTQACVFQYGSGASAKAIATNNYHCYR